MCYALHGGINLVNCLNDTEVLTELYCYDNEVTEVMVGWACCLNGEIKKCIKHFCGESYHLEQ
jgi:hypothetical protein